MGLGGTGCTANTVTAGTTAQQNDHIACCRALTTNIAGRSSSNDSTTLQTLCNIAVMVDLSNMAGGKTDLVAIGRITGGSGLTQLTLRQLTGQRLIQRLPGISSAGDTHSLMDISTAGQGVTDAAADAGCSAAKRLDFGGMVMCFVLKHKKPILVFPINRCGYVY